MGLDPSHRAYNPAMHALFTSAEVRADGVVYLDQEQPTLLHDNFLSIYANPTQPDFLKSDYAFTYPPDPSPEATAAWASAPDVSHGPLEIWVSHGAPRGRLDKINLPGLMGCEAQRRKVAAAKPLLCVFGHFHASYGVEKVVWRDGVVGEADEGVLEREMLTDETGDGLYDLSSVTMGRESIFINAAWMTGQKRLTEERNRPVIVELLVPPH
jgi:hypothetical protein